MRRRFRARIHASIRRAIAGVESQVGSITNSIKPTVRSPFLSRGFIPRQNSSLEMPQPQHAGPVPSQQIPPQYYQVPQQHIGSSSSFHLPVQPPTPNQKPAHSSSRPFHYSKCSGRKKAVCVRVSELLVNPYAKYDTNVRSGRNQLCRDSQGVEWLCERR